MQNTIPEWRFIKRSVFTFSVVCASLIVISSTAVEAKGPLAMEVKTELTQKSLLTDERINVVLKDVYKKFKDNQEGKNADYIKALAIVDPKIFGITLVDSRGESL